MRDPRGAGEKVEILPPAKFFVEQAGAQHRVLARRNRRRRLPQPPLEQRLDERLALDQWIDAPLPTVFHLVIASYLGVYAHFHLQADDRLRSRT